MKAHTASLVNAIALIGLGSWGYLGSDTPSPTALIPVVSGVLLVLMYPGVKKEDKTIGHVATLLTVLILGGLIKPLTASMGRADTLAIMRVSLMMMTSLTALAFFVKSFIDFRRARRLAGKQHS